MGVSLLKKALSYITYHILPSLFWLCVIFGFDTPFIAILTILSSLIHEIGHLIPLFFFSNTPLLPHGHITGFRIKRQGILPYKAEIAILTGGPLANIICALVLLPFTRFCEGYIDIFLYINLLTSLSNLLPAEGYDGYGILYQIFEGSGISTRHLERISFTVSAALTFFSLYLIGKFSQGYWIFGVFFISLASKISKMLKFNVF